jgi:hypothetical protein
MAKLSRKRLETVVKQAAPGYKIASTNTAADARRPSADQSTPDFAQLQRKYGGGSSSVVADSTTKSPSRKGAQPPKRPAATKITDDDQIVALEREGGSDPWDRGARPKSIVVSGAGKVIGRQG